MIFHSVLKTEAQQTFTTFQAANLVIGQPDFTSNGRSCSQQNTSGPSYSAISSKGVLAISEQSGERVCIWKSPFVSNGQLPDVVVGQTSFTSCGAAVSQTQLSNPNGVAFSPDGNKLLVCQTASRRVLIWNSLPTSNGQPADVVIGQTNFTSSSSGSGPDKFLGPTGIFVAPNGKLLVSDYTGNRVMIWNSIPSTNGTPADVVVGQPDFTTTSTGSSANKMNRPWGVWVSPDGKLLVSEEANNRVVIFNSIPTANNASADVVVGQSAFGQSTSGTNQSKFRQPIGVTVSPDGKMAVGEFGNNRVLIFNSIPTTNGANADVVLGKSSFFSTTNGTTSQLMSNVYNVSFDLYGRLFVVGRDMNRGLIFGTFPTKKAELEIKMRATNTVVCAASPTTAFVVIKNNGPDTATNVVSTASLPATFQYISHGAGFGNYNPVSGFWNIPFILPGDSLVLAIAGNSSSGGTFPAFANIIQSNQLDTNFSNNGTSIVYNAQDALNCIQTGIINKAICKGGSVKVPFTKLGTFLPGSVFTAQLSDSSGGFINAQNIGTLTGLTGDTILCIIPSNVPLGNRYRIRVNCDNPEVFGQSNPDNIGIDSPDSLTARVPAITQQARFLFSNFAPGQTSYFWRRNGNELAGETLQKLYAPLAGSYTVAFQSGCGVGPNSQSFVYPADAQLQSINFPVVEDKIFTDFKFKIQASANSGLPLNLSLSGPIALSADSIVILATGTAKITARQGGNLTFDSAATISRNFLINKAPQTIQFSLPSTFVLGNGTISLNGISSSGLQVNYSIVSGNGFLNSLNSFTPLDAGLLILRASHPGNGNFLPAVSILDTICIFPGKPDPISGPVRICKDSLGVFSVSQPFGNGLNWSIFPAVPFVQSGNTIQVSFPAAGTFTISVKFIGSCGSSDSVRTLQVSVFDLPPFSDQPFIMLPTNGNTNVTLPVNLSWFPIPGTEFYDVYLWENGQNEPDLPLFSNLTSINILVGSASLQFGKSYNWKVVARNLCYSKISQTNTFTVIHLPDLIVSSVTIPGSGFSGQNITIQWSVKNNGLGASLSQGWNDRIVLSTDEVLDLSTDITLGTVENLTALNAGQSYNNTAVFKLPNGIQDQYFVFIITNTYNQLSEINISNNSAQSTGKVNITLTPPPDLQVTGIVSPNFSFSGQTINYSFKVKNQGTGITDANSWFDRVYFSSNTEGNLSDATLVGTFQRNGALLVGQEYTVNRSFTLPQGISGDFYLYVIGDVYNNLYEHALETNNQQIGDTIKVLLTPPPDLVPSGIILPAVVSSSQTIPFSYAIENGGGSETSNALWTDKIYISSQSSFNPEQSLELTAINNGGVVNAGETITKNINLTIPQNVCGPHFFYVVADGENVVFEGTLENNNIARSLGPVQINCPDIVSARVSTIISDTAGKSIPVSWKIRNSGPGSLINRVLKEKIYLSQSSEFSAGSAAGLKEISQTISLLKSGDSLERNTQILLPEGLNGTWFLFVHADFTGEIFENNLEANNISRSNAFQLIQGPSPDIQVVSVNRASDTIIAGENLAITFRIENRGQRSTKTGGWTDQVYLSKSAILDTASAIRLKDFVRTGLLGKDSEYVVTGLVAIPGNTAGGNYFVVVFSDVNNQIFESPAENNNTASSAALHIKSYPAVDLSVDEFSAPVAGNSGEPVNVAWKVSNTSPVATLATQWKDALYLSEDTVFDPASDLLAGTFSRSSGLAGGESYTRSQSFVIPNGISGKYYLMMVTDAEKVTTDGNFVNNVKKTTASGDTTKIQVQLSPPVDLIISSVNQPDAVPAGQPLEISLTVINQGVGSIPSGKTWSDYLILSTDLILGNGDDYTVGTRSQSGVLGAGQNYSTTISGIIPSNFQGTYILFVTSDRNNQIYEHLAEGNNLYTGAIQISEQLVSDLIVENVQAPLLAIPGESISIQWNVKNIGANNAGGFFKEAIYLSADEIKTNDDLLIGTVARSSQVISPGGSVDYSFTGNLTGVSEGNYHVLIQTDIQDNIRETNNENNAGVTTGLTEVSIEEIPLNTLISKNLVNNKDQFYKIVIPPVLAGESLLIVLKGDSATGDNEMYLSRSFMPTRANFEFTNGEALGGNQEIIVDQLEAGTYYLLVGGNNLAGSSQNITLFAKKLDFEIRSVNSKKGGNDGRLTLLMKGAKFSNVTQVKLKLGNKSISTDSISIVNPTTMFVTFRLNNAALGLYDVTAINSLSDSTTLQDAFTVEERSELDVAGNVFAPDNNRPGGLSSIRVEFSNAGNIDIVRPRLVLRSLGGALITLDPSNPSSGAQEIVFELKEVNGPAGILRPGASGTIMVYSRTTANQSFFLGKE